MNALLIVLAVFGSIFLIWLFLDRTVFWLPMARDYRKLRTRAYTASREWTAPGRDKAVFLIHEFAGTPASYAHLGDLLSEAGYDVFAPAMPLSSDHADHWLTDKNQPSYSLWLPFANDFYHDLKSRYRKVYIVGASLGGAVALGLAMREHPAALVTLSAPVQLTGGHYRKVLERNLMIVFSALFALFFRFIPTRVSSPEAARLEGISGIEGLLPVRAVHDQKVNLRHLKRGLKRITAPILIMHARGDLTVDEQNAGRIYRGVSSNVRQLAMLTLPADDPTRRHRIAGHIQTRDDTARKIREFFRILEENTAGIGYIAEK